ncbi:S9 family peptidase [uncultured Paraglaciecola sp.]|uniref:S9 family peptidase n=1 Tax=uncultured Paraglaciecola sp. TaxID=1765024 RepID=UPI0025982267|nr:S9 family peptidase [uncultured Paraglaciecola sp.]
MFHRPLKWLLLITVINALFLSCEPTKVTEQRNQQKSYTRLTQLAVPAPIAKQQAFKAEYHGIELSDDYHWLKDRGYPTVDDVPVLDYLTAENQYYAKFIEPNQALVSSLVEEFKGRISDAETSVPWQKNGFEYRWYFRAGEDYKVWVRRPLNSSEEQIILDENLLATDFDYFSLGDIAISPNNQLLAYSYDTDGSERHAVKVLDISSGQEVANRLTNVEGSILFTKDNTGLIYSLLDDEVWRVKSVNLHTLGHNQSQDRVLFAEEDDAYFLYFYSSSSEEYLIIQSSNSTATESVVFNLDDFTQAPQYLSKRKQNFRLSVDHGNGFFYLLSNDTHTNFKISKVSDTNPSYENWQDFIAGSDDKYLKDLQVFKDFVAVSNSVKGIQSLSIVPNDKPAFDIPLPEKVASVGLNLNPEFNQQHVRIAYESMITPESVYDFDIASKILSIRKTMNIPSGYDKTQYYTERLMAPSRDGVEVPVSIVYKKGFKKDASQPIYLYGYGAYARGMEPTFAPNILSLLDRGFAFAIAHVRGGDEMGYQWYLDGKLTKRQNTFNDFVDVAQFLIDKNYVAKGNISISGRSAGGELMGAVVNQAPELWRSVKLGVPFVDVLNTMLDASLPLTPPEWSEWGNPIKSKTSFEYIKSYSPYDNIEAKAYPPMLVTGGLNDPRVTYWEPAKWTAKLRATKTDQNLLVMRINMGAGHFSNTGRYAQLKDSAEEYAFTLLAHGIKE